MIKHTGNFKHWVQKVLPTVYDDSLSYYELLTKVIEFLNQVVDQTNELTDFMENTVDTQNTKIQTLRDEFDALREWAENEGLQDRVGVVLNEWFDNGKLADIINTDVFNMKLDTSIFNEFRDNTNAELAQIAKPSIKIDVTAPPKETGLLPLTMTDPVEDGIRLKAMFDYIKENEIDYQPLGGSHRAGANFILEFPTGIYEWDSTVTMRGMNINLQGKRAIIRVSDGSYAFESSSNHGWKLIVNGFTFDNCNAIKQVNQNLEAGRTNIDNCWFYYSPSYALWIDKQSSMTFINNCHFYKCENIGYFTLTDSVYMNDCWFNEAERTLANPESITIKSQLFINNSFFIPTARATDSAEVAWIRNEGYTKISNSRVSSEDGAKTLINNYAIRGTYNNGFEVVNCTPLSCLTEEGYVVRLYEIPNIMRVANNGINPVKTIPMGYANDFDMTKIPSQNNTHFHIVDVSGNVGQSDNAWGVPEELKPFIRLNDMLRNSNLGLGTLEPQEKLHIAEETGGKIRLERLSADGIVTTDDLYGGIDYYGNDASSNSGGLRAIQQVISEGSLGEVAFVFSMARSNSKDLEEAFRINSNKKAIFGGNKIQIISSRTPTSASSAGEKGEISWDNDYVYVCVATDTWKRTALSSW